MDLRTYIENDEEAWMWIYSEQGVEAVNMEHVVSIRLQGGEEEVMIIATTIGEDEIVLKTCRSGGGARDWLKSLLASINQRDNFQK